MKTIVTIIDCICLIIFFVLFLLAFPFLCILIRETPFELIASIVDNLRAAKLKVGEK